MINDKLKPSGAGRSLKTTVLGVILEQIKDEISFLNKYSLNHGIYYK